MADITSLLWVGGGGAVGAWCRFQCTAWFSARFGNGFPYGTLFVNVLGAFIIGVVVAAIKARYIPETPWNDGIVEGFLGALTTFSTFSIDTFKLYAHGEYIPGTLNLLLHLTLCLLAVAAGVHIMI